MSRDEFLLSRVRAGLLRRQPLAAGMPERSTAIREDLGIKARSRFRVLPDPRWLRSDRYCALGFWATLGA